MAKYFSLVFILLLSIGFATAQSNYIISGKVLIDETGLPLQGASVFAQNTTLGTVTDAEGNFRLSLPGGGYDLVVSFTGRQTDSRRVSGADANESMLFKLKEKQKELEEVAIISSNEVKDGWVKYGSFFTENFIGQSANAKQTNIKNPEVLKFVFSKRKNRLKITAKEPLVIENNALGYVLKYELDSFVHEYNTNISVYGGFPKFEEMSSADTAQVHTWKLAREKAYDGSILHFMRSLYDSVLKDDGFEVRFIGKNEKGEDKEIKLSDAYKALNYAKDDSVHLVEIKPSSPELAILNGFVKPSKEFLNINTSMPRDFILSFLSIKHGESFFVEQNGYFYDQNDITINGYWNWAKVADMLPYDFE